MKTSWKKKIRNERFLKKAKTNREIIRIVKGRTLRYFGHIMIHESLKKDLLEGKVNGKIGKGRPTVSWGDNIKKWMGKNYAGCKRTAQNGQKWRQLVACNVEHDQPTL